MITRKLFAALFLFPLVFAVATLHAQITTATLVGTVTDSTGAVVPGAQVTVTNVDTNASRTATSNEEGAYRIEFLPVGNYRLDVAAKGFKTYRRSGITLEVAQIAQADISLQIGQTSESVEVNDALPLINVTNPEIGRTVQPQEISALPLVNRNVYNLLDLTPGVQRNDTAGITLGYPEQRTLINGGVDGGTGSVNYYLDGGNNMTSLRNTGNILPSPDAIQEFRVQTNSYSAEYGRFANGIINVVTKSGTNQWHGSLFEFVRNTMFNANPWGTAGLPSPPLHRNQFGGTVGGPIIHDKTFFFLSYSGLRQITNPFLTGATVPSGLERTGNFSQSAKKPTGFGIPASGIIPAASLDPVAMRIINSFIPPANGPNNTWRGFISNFDDRDEGLLKIDHAITHNQQLTASFFETYGKASVKAGGGNLPWSLQRFDWRQYNANVSDTWTMNDHMINQTWLSYTRNFGGRVNLPGTSLTALSSGLSVSPFQIQGTPSLPQITVGSTGFGSGFTLGQAIAGPVAGTNFYSIRDVFSYNHGRHSLKFGAELSLNKDIQQTLLNNYGVFSFNGGSTGNSLADLELGIPNSLTQDAPVTGYTNSWYTAFFAQDDWRVSNRLTINLGLRYDVQTPPTDTRNLNRESTYVPGPQIGMPGTVVQSTTHPNAPAGMLFAGDPGVPRGIAQTRLDHFSPRIGFAWDPLGDGKTSIRGGAGVFYGSLSGNQWNSTTNFEPFAIRFTFPNAGSAAGARLATPYRGLASVPFPYNGQFISGGSIFGVDRNFEWPYTYQLNLSAQRQLGKDFSIMAAYVGSLSHNLPFAYDFNYPVITPTATSATSNILARRPFGILNPTAVPFGQIFLVESNQTANYHSLQLSATKRMGHHFSLNSFYTYSKSLESVELQNNTTQALVQDFRNIKAERGRTDDDIRHQFVISGLWDLSYYSGSSGLAKWFINGWSIDPILKVRSGLPFTVTNGLDANLEGNTANERAQFLGGNPSSGTCPNGAAVRTINCWFNTSVFAQNLVVTGRPVDGNTPRNFLTGPGSIDVDLAIARHFKIGESFDIEFRAEGTNILNHANLNPPGTGVSTTPNTPGANGFTNQVNSANFGKIISAFDPRLLQFGIRLTF